MIDTESQGRPTSVIRVACSPELYKQFKLAALEADMSKRDAMDAAFKLFAQVVRKGLAKKDAA